MSNPRVPQVYGLLEANETDPAVINCLVRCLNHTGIYSPALLLINTKEATPEYFSTRSIITAEYEISFSRISTCEAANNYTMEFEYYFYPRNARLDGAVIVCGVVHPYSQPACWGQSYAVINYNQVTTTSPPTTTGPPITTGFPTTTGSPTTIGSPTTTGSQTKSPSTTATPTATTTANPSIVTAPIQASNTTPLMIICIVLGILFGLAVITTVVIIVVLIHMMKAAKNQRRVHAFNSRESEAENLIPSSTESDSVSQREQDELHLIDISANSSLISTL